MNTIRFKTFILGVSILICSFLGCVQAQKQTPEWLTKLPVKKGFIYGSGTGNSANLSMAYDKSRMAAKTALTNNYENKLETFALKCDTVLGSDNKIRQIITTITTSQSATLTGVDEVEKVVVNQNETNIVYLLLRMDVSSDVKNIEKEIQSDAKLKKKLGKAGLLKELSKL
jgi:hypothetical protein